VKRISKRALSHTRKGYTRGAGTRETDDGPLFYADRVQAGFLPLSRAKKQWIVGDWGALAALAEDSVAHHPEREKLALLVACAHQQLANHKLAREYAMKALAWGCDRQLVARFLISGIHNTLGRAAVLSAGETVIDSQFTKAMAVTGDAESGVAAPVRAIHEISSLGLVPKATRVLQAHVDTFPRNLERAFAATEQVQTIRLEMASPRDVAAHWRSNTLAAMPSEGVTATNSSGVGSDALVRAQAQWQLDDWEALTAISPERIQEHPDRAQLALFAAAGRYQMADVTLARKLTLQALNWGCSPQFVWRVLISGAHHALCRAAAALRQVEQVETTDEKHRDP